MIIVTGGAGFIGANFLHQWLATSDEPVVVVDKLTYAGNPDNLAPIERDPRFALVQADICDRAALDAVLAQRPRALIHFAAETHVDRSLHGPAEFIRTNITGTFTLLEACRSHLERLEPGEAADFRFLNVSTDEVYGSLGEHDAPFAETTAYAPNSPYSASKAAADHLVRAYFHSYGLPVLTTNCSNNYGPYQFPEKLIPLMVLNALEGRPLPVYGDGGNVRDWLYVGDHCNAIRAVLTHGRPGEVYNIGTRNEVRNLDLVRSLCAILDQLRPRAGGSTYDDLIRFVADRPGHDRRYAIEPAKIETQIGWRPTESFESGLRKTVQWYLDNPAWTTRVRDGRYQSWIDAQYAQRTPAQPSAVQP